MTQRLRPAARALRPGGPRRWVVAVLATALVLGPAPMARAVESGRRRSARLAAVGTLAAGRSQTAG